MDYYMMRSEQGHEARRVRRRIWFTVHVALYVAFSLSYALALNPDMLLLMVKSLLLSTIIMHAAWLYMIGLYESAMQDLTRRVHATLADFTPQTTPLLADGRARIVEQRHTRRDFWFRWHDVG